MIFGDLVRRCLCCSKRTDIEETHELPSRPKQSSPVLSIPSHSPQHHLAPSPHLLDSTDGLEEYDVDSSMAPKRKSTDAAAAAMDRPAKKAWPAKKAAPEVYSTQQKAAIQQFISFTQLDRSTAIRALKGHGWDAQTAVNAYYSGSSGGGGAQTSSTSKTSLNKLFDKYQEASAPDKDIVGVEGTMQYFEETGVDAEGLEALAALEIVQAPTMGEMSRENFIKGWSERSCDTVDKQKAYLRNLKSELSDNKELFTRVYRYTFSIAKPTDQRAVPLEMATVYWELLFSSPLSAVKWSSPNTPWLSWWTEFLNTSWKKSVNKDMWNETLKFAQLSLEDESMSFWNEESSWPSVIDDFVEFVKKDKRGGTDDQPMDEDEL